MPDQKYRVGIIGTGRVAMDYHIPSIIEAGGVLHAIADTAPGRAEEFAGKLDIKSHYEDPLALINNAEIDVVTICTPPVSHCDLALAAIEKNRHVYMEKPPAVNAAEIEAILRAAENRDCVVFSGSNLVYNDEIQSLKKEIDNCVLGELYFLDARKIMSRNIPRGWHRDKKTAGGGVVMDSAAHRLDLALYLLGNPDIVSVTAFTKTVFPEFRTDHSEYVLMDVAQGSIETEAPYDVDDSFFGIVHFSGGQVLQISDQKIAHMADEVSFKVYGTQGGAELFPPTLYLNGKDNEVQKRNFLTLDQKCRFSHTMTYRRFFDEIDSGSGFEYDPLLRSYNVMKIIDAIYKSSEQGGKQILF